jgi:undecaprenyl-diphosphatase
MIKKIDKKYILLLLSTFVFILLAVLVSTKATYKVDAEIFLYFKNQVYKSISIGPAWLLDFFLNITHFGNVKPVVSVTVLFSFYLIVFKKGYLADIFLLQVIGAGLSDLLLKNVFARPRPLNMPHLVYVNTHSFPSGHAAMSIVIYFSCAFILTYPITNKKLKTYILTAAAIFSFIIGFSRIYISVHYLTDVLAGWALGLTWFSIGWILMETKSKLSFKNVHDE